MYKIIGADQKEYGPISADQLRQWIAEGRVNGQTQILLEGGVWKSVSEVPEFAASVPPPAPPVPPGLIPPPMGKTPPGVIAPMPYPMAPIGAKSNQMAVWAMATGIFSLVCCQLLGPVSVVLGVIALSQIKNQPPQTGSGFAISGIVLGVLSLIVLVIAIAMYMSNPQSFPGFPGGFNR